MPKIGHFILHSNFLPSITAGRYELESRQTGLPFEVAPEVTHIQVAAPRFTMPTDQILSSFPPANGDGAYGDRLPQVVLKRRTLPWERNPAGGADVSTTPWLALVVVAEGEAELSDTTPVAQCTTPGNPLFDPSDRDVEQGLYLAVTETVVKKIFPTRDDLPLLTHVRQVDVADTELAGGDDDGWLAVVLANRLPVYDTAADKPVRYMACLLNIEGQLHELPPETPVFDVFTVALAQDWRALAHIGQGVSADALVMKQADLRGVALPGASALPRDGRPGLATPGAVARATSAGFSAAAGGVPVASLAGALDGAQAMPLQPVAAQWQQTTQLVAQAALGADPARRVRDTMRAGFRYPISQYAQERVLRFPVLAHWSFTTSKGDTFETLLQNLDVGLLGTLPPEPERPAGQPEPPPRPAQALPEVVDTGHIGLGHRARRGDAVRAWYRGPCVPFPTARNGQSGNGALPLAHAADQLRRVIPDGREDLSLAAAFEIGRLLALSQLSVVSALLRFRGEQFGAGRVRELLAQALPFELPRPQANAGLGHVDLGRFVAVQMLDALALEPQRMLGPKRPLADPGRPLKLEGDIDQLIATGLGLNHAELMKRSAEIGVLAALERQAAPVAGRVGAGEFGNAELKHLQQALVGELVRTLQVAMPPVAPTGPVTTGPITSGPRLRSRSRAGTAAPPAADTADALDTLIDQAPADLDEADDGSTGGAP